ncbi:MAG: cardiolipin synthase [Lachnospiraceae bacterium]
MRYIIQRIFAVIPAVLLQLLWIALLLSWLAPYATILNLTLTFFTFIYVLYIMSNRNESTYKTLWLLIILGLPITGTILYLYLGNKKSAKPLKKKLKRAKAAIEEITPCENVYTKLKTEDLRMAQTFCYVQKKTGFPVTFCEETDYYPLGEKLWEQMLADMEAAEKFIFAEYFIVENGVMWNSMVKIMEKKAAEGVDVRIMYDDLGSISTYSKEDVRQLKKKGIKCITFNPLVFIRGTINYRDHRKMLIIDGKTAFSGGINLADEYINRIEKYGHWKDIGFRITGEPVKSYTKMFTEFWNAFSKEPVLKENLLLSESKEVTDKTNGYVLSYYDSPIHSDAVSNNLYVELLSQATKYAWFFTPYLMLGDTLLDAFIRACERGVDVRIIMPGIPDKKLVYRMSRSYYPMLLKAGVKIYEYTPGFVHAKGCIIDDVIGTIGTVNLDYRSLFLHFENNSLFYQASLLADLKQDFQETQEKCVERTLDNIGFSFCKWIMDGILRIFAPLC